MTIKINIRNCVECKYRDHSGAFTPGGAIYICRHKYAPKGDETGVKNWKDITTPEIARRVFGPREINFKEIPEWCPLKKGYS